MLTRFLRLVGRDGDGVPANYTVPRFPSLYWPPDQFPYTLQYLSDMWRFTVVWTVIIYAIFHLAAAGIALVMQADKLRTNWKYLWIVPLIYAFVAGAEALFAGSIVGLMLVALDFVIITVIANIWLES